MKRMTYETIAEELASADQWFRSLGLIQQADRIRLHIKTVRKLVAAKLAGKLETLDQGDVKFYWSLTEGIEFVDIYGTFKDMAGSPDFMQKVKDALGGPADPNQETEKSSLGRNTMFELNLAAQVHLCGLPVLLKINPDVLCELNNINIYVQCKRPFRQETIPDNIHGAAKQLTRDLDGMNDQNARGIVAISVSRVFNAGDQLFVGQDELTTKNRLGDEVQALGERCRDSWSKIADPRIVGILFHVITPSHIQDINLLTVAQQTTVFSVPDRTESDVNLLRSFAKIIGQN